LEDKIVQLKEDIDSGSKKYWVKYGASVYRNATAVKNTPAVDNSKTNDSSETWLKDVNKAVSPKSSKYYERLKNNSGSNKKSNQSSNNNNNNNVQVKPEKSSFDYYIEGLTLFNQAKWHLDRDQFFQDVKYQANYRFGEETSKLSERFTNTSSAIQLFKKAIELSPHDIPYKIHLAAAHLMRGGFSLDVGCYNSPSGSYAEHAKKSWDCNTDFNNQDLNQVLTIYYSEIHKGNENDELKELAARAYFYLGRIKSFQCNQSRCYTQKTSRSTNRFVCDPCWNKVIELYDQSIQLGFDSADVYQLRGAVHQHRADGNNAKPDFDTARSMGFSNLSLIKYIPET